ncbi:TRAP transporter large permease subunit, partial [Faecalibacterium prausnitzii]
MNINIWLPLLCIVALAMFNVPIWLALLGGALPYFLILQPTLPVQIAVQRVVAVTETSSYLAIPFFITAGAIMNYAGISSRLLDLADGLVGHLTGGLGHVNILLSVLMGGVSGSAAADASMEAKILVPEMLKRGYDEEFSAAITIASSLITPIIPPGMGLLLGFGGSAVGILRTVGLLCLLLAGGKPLVQGGKGGAALGQLLFPV